MTPPRSDDPKSLVERLVPEVFEGSHRSPTVSTFLRGVTTGALVGAAIAGSALWSRYRRSRSSTAPAPAPIITDPDTELLSSRD
jgi:hypothetical protein